MAVESAESWPATRAPICKPVLGHLGLATNRHASRADGIAGVIAAGVDLGPLADGVDSEAGGLRDEPIGALALAAARQPVRQPVSGARHDLRDGRIGGRGLSASSSRA